MYNDHDEMYEVSDFDEDIESRKALIEEIKAIEISDNLNAVMRDVADLKRRWKRIAYWESAYEDTLAEEFERYIDAFYAKRREGYENVQAIKQELIDEARKVAEMENFNQGSEAMNDLMAQWKAAGSAGKDDDDALWDAFNEARQKFFDRKHEYWENMKERFENARQVKEDLIKQAAALCDSEEWQSTGAKYRTMMDQWKAVGSAGREHEDRLWNAFNESRQKFYSKRDAYYEELHGEQDEKYAAKQALVKEAEEIASSGQYTREHTDRMKALGAQWKNIGSCGKDREDDIWKEFRTKMDSYFDGLKQFNEQRHMEWRQRMMEKRSRKLELIQNQKRQIKRMEEEMVGLLGQRAIDEMEESIADKEDFIAELEEQLEEIDKSLES